MAEEDLIFGKNRHFFGGIEPSNMLTFTAHGGMPQGQYGVLITATLPNDTVVNEQTLCTVKGAIIRRKTTDYPKDEFDGDLVADIRAYLKTKYSCTISTKSKWKQDGQKQERTQQAYHSV